MTSISRRLDAEASVQGKHHRNMERGVHMSRRVPKKTLLKVPRTTALPAFQFRLPVSRTMNTVNPGLRMLLSLLIFVQQS